MSLQPDRKSAGSQAKNPGFLILRTRGVPTKYQAKDRRTHLLA